MITDLFFTILVETCPPKCPDFSDSYQGADNNTNTIPMVYIECWRMTPNEIVLSGEKPNKGVRWVMCGGEDHGRRRRNRRNGPKRV